VKIVDTNILINAVNSAAAHHTICRRWMEDALTGDEHIGLNWIAISGFLRVATRPRVFVQPLAVDEAILRVQEWLDVPCTLIVEPAVEHWTLFKELILAVGTAGNLTTDAHLAALAISHDSTLVSCDTDFARFRRLKWENPLAVP